jgi:hypothetical protein
MTPFVYFPTLDKIDLITDPTTVQMTENGQSTVYFKDCRVNLACPLAHWHATSRAHIAAAVSSIVFLA